MAMESRQLPAYRTEYTNENKRFFTSCISRLPLDSEIINLDPTRDVLLLIGKEKSVGVRVCAKVLSLSSPVFEAMLSPRWLNGDKPCLTEPFTLRPPEDEADTVIQLCRVLHFQCALEDPISFTLFEKLALLCHKYDFGRGLGP